MNYKRMLSIFAMPAAVLSIAILTTGCQLSSPNRTSFPNDSTGNGRNYRSSENGTNDNSFENGTNDNSSENDTNNNSSENGRNYRSSQRDINRYPEQISELNLTDNQKAQIRRIRTQNEAKVVALLSPEQQEEFESADNSSDKLSMSRLRSLNLSANQKKAVNQIIRNQRKQIQAVLTTEQREMMKQRRMSPRENTSY
ncbi:Spy/CpxP family protein refolding chaperone [Anabaena lutea]|uniref:Spy/CpxP family protein refolding chaperone n=1 Tax=Anabaena lutea FACHB-196 TaxID=2692881 RepID=A0ABR8F8N3_9NOST|nr:Spy/CpxP family protein refolding chaperone [Anabaena lutea]MBD2566570.1 Spy/CpxP family protein refolding chaperone [Anabaena lutea FACHB-196]